MTDIVERLRAARLSAGSKEADAPDELCVDAAAEIEALRKIESAVTALADYCQRSVNAGPVTKGPHREAALWRGVYAALKDTTTETEGG